MGVRFFLLCLWATGFWMFLLQTPSLATNAQVIIRITVDVVVGAKPVDLCWVRHSQEVEYPRWDEHVLVNKHIVEIQIK